MSDDNIIVAFFSLALGFILNTLILLVFFNGQIIVDIPEGCSISNSKNEWAIEYKGRKESFRTISDIVTFINLYKDSK